MALPEEYTCSPRFEFSHPVLYKHAIWRFMVVKCFVDFKIDFLSIRVRKDMLYLTTNWTRFIYRYITSDIW